MNPVCDTCQAKYQVEPGFFFGAAYVSYAFNVALMVPLGFYIFYYLEDPKLSDIIPPAIIVPLVFIPFIYRFSRILWIYWMAGFKYDASYSNS